MPQRFFDSPPIHAELHRTDCAGEMCGCLITGARFAGLWVIGVPQGSRNSPWAPRCRALRGLYRSESAHRGASIRLTSSGSSPVSSHRSKDAGTRPAAFNESINCLIRKLSPSCFLRAAINISICFFPIR